MKFLRQSLSSVLFSVSVIACSDDTVDVVVDKGYLMDATSIGTQLASRLKALVSLSDDNIDPEIFTNNVELFKITYRTQYRGQEIEASGLIVLPQTADPVGMLSYQRGTIIEYRDAPSKQSANSEEGILYSFIASSGFIVIIPDLIGFGSSTDIFHPYYVEEPTAQVIIDMIKASQELATQKEVLFN